MYIKVCLYVYTYICVYVYIYYTDTHRNHNECALSLIGYKPRASSDYYLETSYLMMNPAERNQSQKMKRHC